MTHAKRREPQRDVALPDLVPFDGERLETRGDYDRVEFAGLDLAGQDAADARFVECAFRRCGLDGVRLTRTRVITCRLDEVHATSLDASDSTWREALVAGGRLGALSAAGATWSEIRFRDARIGFLNFAGAKVDDVTFERCEIGTFDARAARLQKVTFVDCMIDELNASEASLTKVDLSGARLRTLAGIESLRGAIVGRQQLTDIAPLLAAQLGIEVRET